LLYRLS